MPKLVTAVNVDDCDGAGDNPVVTITTPLARTLIASA